MSSIYWLSSYPKSGNTWFRTFLRNLIEDGDEPTDINELRTGSIASARGWLDGILGFDTADMTMDEIDNVRPDVYRWSSANGETEYHKIHDAFTLNSKGLPLICPRATKGTLYFVRNPLDVVSSYANHMNCSLDKSIQCMGDHDMGMVRSGKRLNAQVRQKLLTWSEHVVSWIDAEDMNVEVLRYEDMLNDGTATFTRAAEFLEMDAPPEKIEKAIRFSAFKNLRKQEDESTFKEKPPATKNFFRKGKSGGWREELNDKQVAQVIEDHSEVMKRLGYLSASGEPI